MHRRVVLALLSVFLVLTAFPGQAEAHILTADTKFSRRKAPAGPLEVGKTVVIHGQLKSSAPECFGGQTVLLLRRGLGTDKVLQSDVTDAGGEYSFDRRPRLDQHVYVLYEGFTLVDLAHAHSCLPSMSRDLFLNVER